MVNHIQDTGASLGGQADVLKEQALELAAAQGTAERER